MDKRQVEEREGCEGNSLTILNSGDRVKGLAQGRGGNQRGRGILLTSGCEGKC